LTNFSERGKLLKVRTAKRNEPNKPKPYKQKTNMKLDKVIVINDEGESAEMTRADYIKYMVKTYEVAPYVPTEEGQATTKPEGVVTHILRSFEEGQEVNEAIKSDYAELIALVEADYSSTVKVKESKKAEAARLKEEKEKEKEKLAAEKKAKEELMVQTQLSFANNVAAAADLAAKEFITEVEELKNGLPEGVEVVRQGSGYGLSFAKEATQETIGQTLGYLLQKADNSTFIGNQLYFWVGDTIGTAVARGIYDTAKAGAAHIAKVLSDNSGKVIEPASLDQYKRMAERTPVEFRNPKADPTAYLAISTMKLPKKGDNESAEDFKVRLDAFEADRAGLQQQLAVGEVVKRKDIMGKVNEVLIKHGMREAPSDTPTLSIGQQLQVYFHASLALEELLGVHKEGIIMYKEGNNIIEVSEEEMQEKKDSAYANLLNALYTNEKLNLTPADFIRGYVPKQVKVEVAKNAEGKPIFEEQTVKNLVFPSPFFAVPVAEAPAPAATPEPAPAPAPEAAPKKNGKKK